MNQPGHRVSLSSTIDQFLASQGVDASTRVIRGSSSLFVMVTLNQAQTLVFLTQRHRSISDQLTAFITSKIDTSQALDGVYWGFRKVSVASDLQKEGARLTEKIRELRSSRIDFGQSSEFLD